MTDYDKADGYEGHWATTRENYLTTSKLYPTGYTGHPMMVFAKVWEVYDNVWKWHFRHHQPTTPPRWSKPMEAESLEDGRAKALEAMRVDESLSRLGGATREAAVARGTS